MLDVALIRKQPELVRRGLADKGETADLDWFLQQDKEFRAVVTELNGLRARQNTLSKIIGAKREEDEDTADEMASVAEVKEQYRLLTGRKDQLESDLKRILMRMPNLPAEDVPVGAGEADNEVVSTWGEEPVFTFEPKPHWELGEDLGLYDPQAAAKISGAGFALLSGGLAQLERALSNYMLDLHTREHGYTEMSVPFLVRQGSLEGTGQLPKLEGDMYRCRDDELFLIPTAEVPLTNVHRRSVIDGARLPIRYVAQSACFRREAGAAGRDTRGLVRLHQFHKVELMAYVHPDESEAELLRIREHAESVLQALKLRYRVVKLCTGDLSFASRKTFDLELWAPGCKRWLEVSSVSTFGDFQARRAGIRFRTGRGKPSHVHTLNGSGVALPRLLIALLETHQQEDGSIHVPDMLRPYMGWKTEIR